MNSLFGDDERAVLMVTPKRQANIALGLYVVALGLPAIRLGSDWLFGFGALALSFAGAFNDSDLPQGYRLACLLGVLVNVMMIVSYVGIMLGQAKHKRAREVAFLVTAALASVLTVAVLGPLLYNGKLGGVAGYLLWVGAAATLVSAAWAATISPDNPPDFSECEIRSEEIMQEGGSP
jgi:hypothetical protein